MFFYGKVSLKQGWLLIFFLAAFLLAPSLASAKADRVDFEGFIRLRAHVTDYGTYNVGQFMPPDKNTANDNDSRNFFEQRARIYIKPKVGEYLTGNFGWEIDGRWGDSAYGVGQNSGFGFNADQVNLETKNLNFEVKFPGSNGKSAIIGLQTLKDPYNGILMGWSDAGGVTYKNKTDKMTSTFGFYRFWQPTGTLKQNSAVDFLSLEFARPVSDSFHVGFNLHVILDNSGEKAGSTGVLGGDPIGSPQNGYANFAYNASTGRESLVGSTNYTLNLWLPGVNFEAGLGGVSMGGFLIYETGQFTSKTSGVASADISSFASELHAAVQISGFNVKLSGMYVTGDSSNSNSGIGVRGGGFYTPGSFSLAGAWMGQTGMKILFQDMDGTSQDAYLVYDVSNIYEQKPLGILALMLTANSQISSKTSLELGAGILSSAEERIVNGENSMATEINAGLHYNMLPGLTFGAVAAYASVGDFYKVSSAQASAYNATAPGQDVSAYNPDDMWKITFRTQFSF